jgi:hypothetical protein
MTVISKLLLKSIRISSCACLASWAPERRRRESISFATAPGPVEIDHALRIGREDSARIVKAQIQVAGVELYGVDGEEARSRIAGGESGL